MAKTEHQGLQISLILFVMVSVVLAITTFVYYRQAEESDKAALDAKKKMEASTNRANDLLARVDYVLHILGAVPLPEAQVEQLRQGFAADPQMKDVVTDFDAFVSTFGAGMPKDKLNYKSVAPEVLVAVRDRNNSVLQQTEEASKLAKDLETTRTKEAERTEAAAKGHQDADKLLDEEKNKYEADRTALLGKQAAELANYSVELKKKDSDLDSEKKKGDELNKAIKVQVNTITDQKKTITEMRDEEFEVADGQVTGVNQGANLVWINLGLADGLRRQTLFSVYDQADNGVTRTKKKASIEVTRVIDQHLAEARIILDVYANPIMTGDQIFSPAWRPGKRVRFALVGLMDIDGNRISDLTFVRSLLAASGGEIDKWMDDDGTVKGTMTSATRYLVRGVQPDERTDQKVLGAYTAMLKEAEELGVETIGIDVLLDWVGYHPEDRSVGLGRNADPNQFKPKPPEGKSPTSTGAVSGKFRERKPTDKSKDGKKGSAFDK